MNLIEGCTGGAVPAPAPSYPLGLHCGFLWNHPDQSKHGTHLMGLTKAFLTSLPQVGSVLCCPQVQTGTMPLARVGMLLWLPAPRYPQASRGETIFIVIQVKNNVRA